MHHRDRRKPAATADAEHSASTAVDAGGSAALLAYAWQRQHLQGVRIQAQQAQTIAALTERFRTLVEGASDAFFAHDFDGRFVEVNRHACESTGYTRDELLTMTVSDIDPTFDLAGARRIWAWQPPGRGLTVGSRHRRRDGTTFPVEIRVSTCDVEGQRLVLSLVRDVSERERSERALRERGDELARINRELEEFAYVASHDLKAPLRAVANLALVVDEDAGPCLDAENRHRLRLLRERVKAMDALIEGLLSYARLSGVEREAVPVELGALLRDLVDGLALPAGFEVAWDDDLPTLIGDPAELRQVLAHLLRNAADHHDHPAGGHVRVGARDAGDHWQIEVADDGPGIPEHRRERVFRMFSTDGKPHHTGIGLAVTRKLVLSNGGRIEVVANVPGGSRFCITWPKKGSM